MPITTEERLKELKQAVAYFDMLLTALNQMPDGAETKDDAIKHNLVAYELMNREYDRLDMIEEVAE